MKVIGTGLCRTGTASLRRALEHLGFPCLDSTGGAAAPLFEVIAGGGHVDWHDGSLEGIAAAVGCPASCNGIWQQLVHEYTDAMVIHTTRDADEWYDSAYDTVWRHHSENGSLEWLERLLWWNTFRGKFEDRDYAIKVFNRRQQEVLDAVPAARLLVFNIAEGWAPLCAFLGVEVPDAPFPHERSSAEQRPPAAEHKELLSTQCRSYAGAAQPHLVVPYMVALVTVVLAAIAVQL